MQFLYNISTINPTNLLFIKALYIDFYWILVYNIAEIPCNKRYCVGKFNNKEVFFVKFKKLLASLLVATLSASAFLIGPGLSFMNNDVYAVGTSSSEKCFHYFYDQLQGRTIAETESYQKFYKAMEKMEQEGMFKRGEDLNLVEEGYFTSEEVKSFAEGTSNVLNIFGAARDAYSADHPDVFYVDFSSLSIRITSKSDGTYNFYMGSGRRDNYRNEAFKSEKEVETAIEKYEESFQAALAVIRKNSQELADQRYRVDNNIREADTDEYVGKGTIENVDIVEAAHDYVTKNTSYRLEDKFDSNDSDVYLIRTSYGSFVNQKAVCEGYARAFKSIMDEYGIPCILVYGAYRHSEDVYELHMWSYVELEDEKGNSKWYAVDPTMDDPYNKDLTRPLGVDGYESHEYLMKGDNKMGVKYAPSGIMSESNYEFTYPSLSYDNYTGEIVFNSNGFVVDLERSGIEGVDSGLLKMSYNSMGFKQAREAGYYLLINQFDSEEGKMTGWTYMTDPEIMGNPYYSDVINEDGTSYVSMQLPQVPYVQYGVTTIKPETYEIHGVTFEDSIFYGTTYDILARTDMIYNKWGNYQGPPYPLNISPVLTSALMIDGTDYQVRYEFDRDVILSGSVDDVQLDVNVIDMYGIKNDSAIKHSKFGNMTIEYKDGTSDTFSLEGRINDITQRDDTPEASSLEEKIVSAISFDFKPSDMYADDNVFYEFTFRGVEGKSSGKTPMSFSYLACHRCAAYAFQSQGYDWNVFGKPTLMDDLSSMDVDFSNWKVSEGSKDVGETDEDILKALEGLTHRMVLVSTTPNEEQQTNLENALAEDSNVSSELLNSDAVDKDKIEYYNINLTLCKKQIVSTGQAVRVTLGFPAGYGPEDKGTTFKVYHFKTDDSGNVVGVNEIPCEITEYGLVVYCDEFSPFAIVPVDIEAVENSDTISAETKAEIKEAASHKTILYSTTFGGTIESDDNSGTIILKDGDSATIKITADEGYYIDTVTVGGVIVDENDSGTKEITLSYEELPEGSTVIEAQFVAKSVVENMAENETTVKPSITAHNFNPASGVCDHCGTLQDGFTSVAGHSLTLEGNIGVNFYMCINEENVSNAKAIIKLPDGTQKEVNVEDLKVNGVVPGLDESNTYYKITCEVSAKDIKSPLSVQIVSGDLKGTVYTYMVADYISSVENDTTGSFDSLKPLVSAMSNYGTNASKFFAKETVEETDEMKDITAENLAEYKAVITGTLPEGIEYLSSSLILESQTTLRHYFKVENGVDISSCNFEGPQVDGYYYIDIENIAAQDLDKTQTITVGGYTITCSPLSYVYAVLNSKKADENLRNLVKSVYIYNAEANNYFD